MPLEPDRLRASLQDSLGQHFVGGNVIERLVNGDRIFPAMLQAIREARRSIDFLTFVYWAGPIADEFAEALVAAAARGVRVRVLLDAFGSGNMPDSIVAELESGGVQVQWFRPLRNADFVRITNRTHRKVLVTDDEFGFTGGVGIAREWEGDARNPDEWRETHFRCRGPVVRGLRAAFLENWAECAGWVDDEDLIEAAPVGSAEALTVRSKGGAGWSDILTVVWTLLSRAERSIVIETAYFVPSKQQVEELERALARGVEVKILLPGKHTDQRLCNLATGSELEWLTRAGASIHLYQQTMLHAKLLLVDERMALIGSPNFNRRSSLGDDEVALLVHDAELVADLTRDYEEDLRHAEPFDPARWKGRSLWTRCLESVARRIRTHL